MEHLSPIDHSAENLTVEQQKYLDLFMDTSRTRVASSGIYWSKGDTKKIPENELQDFLTTGADRIAVLKKIHNSRDNLQMLDVNLFATPFLLSGLTVDDFPKDLEEELNVHRAPNTRFHISNQHPLHDRDFVCEDAEERWEDAMEKDRGIIITAEGKDALMVKFGGRTDFLGLNTITSQTGTITEGTIYSNYSSSIDNRVTDYLKLLYLKGVGRLDMTELGTIPVDDVDESSFRSMPQKMRLTTPVQVSPDNLELIFMRQVRPYPYVMGHNHPPEHLQQYHKFLRDARDYARNAPAILPGTPEDRYKYRMSIGS